MLFWPEWGCLFLMFAVCFIKFLMYWNFFALNVPKSSYLFVKRLSVINWSPKEGNEWFWNMRICAICGNLLESNFFSGIWVVGIPRQWNFLPNFWERFVLTNVIMRGLGKNNLEFAVWWKITWFLCAFFSCFLYGLLVSFFSTFWRNIYCFLMVGTGY